MKVWEAGADFETELKADPEVRAALSEAEIAENFDLGHHMRHVDAIFARVFGAAGLIGRARRRSSTRRGRREAVMLRREPCSGWA